MNTCYEHVTNTILTNNRIQNTSAPAATRRETGVLDCICFTGTCHSSPCMHGGSCVLYSTGGYTCNCSDTGFTGFHCEGML